MEYSGLNRRLRVLEVTSPDPIPEADRELVVAVANDEILCRGQDYQFILHEVLDSVNAVELLIEGSGRAIGNLVAVLRTCFPQFGLKYWSYEWDRY